MNDRYLYRAKRTDNGEFIEGLLTIMWGQFHIINPDDENTAYPIDESTICQCTGLKDKNGKLIWENDIVDFLGHKGKVVYECGSFGIAYRDYIDWEEIEANICHITGCDNALYACENDNFISLWEIYWNFNDEDYSVNTVKVIGSAIDNPELLEVGE
ncbi:MAG: YopX family protein [Lachnospiraceae bacterium]